MTTNLDRSGGLANSNLQAGSSGGSSGGPSTPHTEQRVLRTGPSGEEPTPEVGSLWVTGETVSRGHLQENRQRPNRVNSYTEVTNANWLGVFFSANRPDASANNGKFIYHAGVGSFQRAGFQGFAGFGSYAWSNVGAPSFALPWRGAWDSEAAATEHVQATGDKVIYGSTLYSADDFTAGSAAMDVLSWQPVDEGAGTSERILVARSSTGISEVHSSRGITTNTDLTFNGNHNIGATTLTVAGSLAHVSAGMYMGTGLAAGITPYRIASVDADSQQITLASPGLTVATTDGEAIVVVPMLGTDAYIQLPSADYQRINITATWVMSYVANPARWALLRNGFFTGSWVAGGEPDGIGDYVQYYGAGGYEWDSATSAISGKVPIGLVHAYGVQWYWVTYDPDTRRVEFILAAASQSQSATGIPVIHNCKISGLS